MLSGSDSPAKTNSIAPLMWAVYLGVSWTWVVGMFLPALLVRDYGLLGWVVFAIPNVIGAAAMGWVLRDGQASAKFVRRHSAACYWFSVVTIAYHVFFAAWMIQRLRGWAWIAMLAFVIAALVKPTNRARWGMALFALIASVTMWFMLDNQETVLSMPSMKPTHAGGSAASSWLIFPAFAIGFALCPYLDLTFHRARQATSVSEGRFAFGFGFGVVFFAMIVFTLTYSRWIVLAVDGNDLSPLTAMFLCIHLIIQSAFTVSAHAREIATRMDRRRGWGWMSSCAIFAALALGMVTTQPHSIRGRDAGEIVYWCLLGFYGFVFPAYLLMKGTRGIIAVAVVSVVAFPFYWMGFVERQPAWLLGGAIVMLGSRLFSRRQTMSEPVSPPLEKAEWVK